MPTTKDSLYFNYDGISSKTYNLINVNISGSMFEETFHASRIINETKVKGNDTPLFNGIDEDPLQLTLTLAFESQYTDTDIDNIIVWLFKDIYKPLYFEDKPNKIYYCMPVGDASIVHNGLKKGYLNITMRCKSSKIYSPQQTTVEYDLSNNGLLDPSISAIMSLTANANSTLTAGIYYVAYTWYNSQGQTTIGNYAIPNINVTTGNDLTITIPTLPTDAIGANIYVGISSTQLIYQGNTTSTTYSISSPINTTNNAPPSTNMTSSVYNININNGGHIDIYPEISFTNIGAGTITFTKDGQIFEVKNLTNGEQIYIDCGREIIETDAVGVSHYDDVVGDYSDIILKRGDNTIGVQGMCKIQFRYVFKYKF